MARSSGLHGQVMVVTDRPCGLPLAIDQAPDIDEPAGFDPSFGLSWL
jgi:hypothetical protein